MTQTKAVHELQGRVLDAITREQPVHEVMHFLCTEIERLAPDTAAMILIMADSGTFQPVAGARAPASLVAAYTALEPADAAGISSFAATAGQDAKADDIATDPRYGHCRQAALSAGFTACRALPIKNSHGIVLALFMLLAKNAAAIDATHRSLIRISLPVCQIALEREKAREHIHHLTFYDTSTGLPNRSMLRSHVSQLLLKHRRTATPLALMLIKLQGIGQAAAAHTDSGIDRLRQTLIRRVQEVTRQSDILGILGPDEIAVILPRCTMPQANVAAERFLHTLRQPVILDNKLSYQSSISIGIAIYPDDSKDFETLVRHASIAMLHASSDNRQGVCVFQAAMNRAAQERLRLETDLRNALQTNGLHMHYQPQISSDPSIGLLGVEALARWHHPELGNIEPSRFIQLAEESDLVDAIALWTISHACSQLADWRKRNVPIPRVAVNLSAVNLRNPALPGTVAAILDEYHLKPCDLTLEITETAILHPDPTIGATVNELHRLGILLSLDDFGTGYSSLSYLHRLPIRELKLDKSFIADLEHSSTARILTRSILHLADNLGLHVVAEGVETTVQRDFLRSQHCSALQGYLISHPLSAADLEQWQQRQ